MAGRMIAKLFVLFGALFFLAGTAQAQSQDEKRIALVIGNGAYQTGELATSANDAGLIAQTLQAAGFDVVGARDLDRDALQHAFHDFLDKASASGPNTVAFVYLAGYGLQLQGENYFVPIDATIANAAAVPTEALRISDFTKPLAALPLKMSIVVIDGARANNFAAGDQPLAGGLALVDADPRTLIAFNAAPGTVAPQEQGPYGAYAQALAEMMRVGGLPLQDVFDRTRLRVSEKTNGALLPWSTSRITEPFVFFDRGSGAPAQAASYDRDAAMRAKPIARFSARDAYMAALDRDTLRGYEDFLAAYPRDPMARRVRAIVAARREAITWRETWTRDTANAYWSYLRRYPRGPHAWDARRRLEGLQAALEPPATFETVEYDVPPPPETEIVYVDRPVLVFSDPDFDLPPPPPPPVIFLPPPPPDFVDLAPPPPLAEDEPYMLPAPPFVAVPEWVRPPRYVEPPPQNFIFNNIHNAQTINEVIENPRREPVEGQPQPGVATGAAVAAGAAAAAALVALPPYLRNRAAPRNPGGVNRANGQPGLPGQQRPGVQPLPGQANVPGVNGQQPLPGQRNQIAPNGQRPLPGQNNLPGTNGQPLPGQRNQLAPNGQKPLPGQNNLPGMNGQPLPGQRNQLAPNGQRPLPGQNNRPGTNGQPLPGQRNQIAPNGQKPLPGQNNLPGTNGQPLPGQRNELAPNGQKPLPGQKKLPGTNGQPGQKNSLPGMNGQPLPPVGGEQQNGAPIPGGKPGHGKKGKQLPGQVPENGTPAGRGGNLPGAAPLAAPENGNPQPNVPRQHRRNQPGGNELPGAGAAPNQTAPKPRMRFAPPAANPEQPQIHRQPQARPEPQIRQQPLLRQEPRPQPQPRQQPQIRQEPRMQPMRQQEPRMQVRPEPGPRPAAVPRMAPEPHPAAGPRPAPAAPHRGGACGKPGQPPC